MSSHGDPLPGMDAQPAVSYCKTCGARIRWCELSGGVRVPLDADPIHPRAHALVTLDGGGDYGHRLAAFGPVYRSHFETCPDAATHRRKG